MKEEQTLHALEQEGNLRTLPEARHDGIWIWQDGQRMLNLSSNDYLGLASDTALQDEFLRSVPERDRLLSASSSRLLTGNFTAHRELEALLAGRFGRESALTFSSGYHANTGILPAVADAHTLILADKLVHASLIDGIRLSAAQSIRYRHQDYRQLRSLVEKHHAAFGRIIIVTESVFSMDGDVAPLAALAELKRTYPNVMLYVDEAHAIGVRGRHGLGRQGVGFGRRIRGVQPLDARLFGQSDANPYLYHGTSAAQCGLDAVRVRAAGRLGRPPRPFGFDSRTGARGSPAGGLSVSFRKPYRPARGGRKREGDAEGGRDATPRLLCPSRPPAHGARRHVAPAPLAHGGFARSGSRADGGVDSEE